MNTLGTEKYQIFPLSPYPPKTEKENKLGPSLSMLEPSHWLHENFILKFVCQHFSGGLMESMGSMGVYW
jgi:hypothetical protein